MYESGCAPLVPLRAYGCEPEVAYVCATGNCVLTAVSRKRRTYVLLAQYTCVGNTGFMLTTTPLLSQSTPVLFLHDAHAYVNVKRIAPAPPRPYSVKVHLRRKHRDTPGSLEVQCGATGRFWLFLHDVREIALFRKFHVLHLEKSESLIH